MKPGDPLSPNAMRDTQHRLYDLGVFARVDTAIQNPDGNARDKYILYDMEEARKYSITTGFGAEFGRVGGCSECLEAPAGQTAFRRTFHWMSRAWTFGAWAKASVSAAAYQPWNSGLWSTTPFRAFATTRS